MLYESYSEMGNYHKLRNEDNQDYIAYAENDAYAVIVLADGVSAKKYAGIGAKLAADQLSRKLLISGVSVFRKDFDTSRSSQVLFSYIQCYLYEQAKKMQTELEELSSTLSAVLFEKSSGRMLDISLGDNLSLFTTGHRCRMLALPESSESGTPVTTTKYGSRFLHMKLTDRKQAQPSSVVLFSDGAWRLLFDCVFMKAEVQNMLEQNDFDRLRMYLKEHIGSDDCSFIAMIPE